MLRKHVSVTEKVLGNLMREDIVAIATGHHERGDGSGYPKKLRNHQMTQEQRVLQVADAVTGMTNKRSYREPLHKDKVIDILKEEEARTRLNKQVVNTFLEFYDDIMQNVQTQSAEIMKMYQTLNSQYSQVSKRFKM